MHVYFDRPRKKTTEFVLQYSIFNFLTVFDIKITKSPRIPNLKWKVDISSNFNGLFHQLKLELFIDVIFMENTEMWNKCSRENDLLKCIVVAHGCMGQTSILKVGERAQHIFYLQIQGTTTYFFQCYLKSLEATAPSSCCIGIVPVKYILLNQKLR